MWKGQAPCREHRFCPLTIDRKEHLVFLAFDYHGGGDFLPCENERFMTLDIARDILTREAHDISEYGKNDILVKLMGGDPFNRFSELQDLCEWAWKTFDNIQTEFELVTSINTEREAEFTWYIDHRDKIRLWLRCDKLSGNALHFALKTGCGIEYLLGSEISDSVYNDICCITENEIPIKINRSIVPDSFTNKAYRQYEQLLNRLQTHPDAMALPWVQETIDIICMDKNSEKNPVNGKCYDTNGWVWTCPYLSHLCLHSWSMDQQLLEELTEIQPQSGLNWLCPGQCLRMSMPDMRERLVSFRYLEFSFGVKVLSKLKNKYLNKAMNKLIIEKKEKR